MNSWGFSLVLTLLEVISVRDTLVMKFSRRLENFFFLFISGKSCSVLMKSVKKLRYSFAYRKKKHTGIIGFQSRLTEECNPFLI